MADIRERMQASIAELQRLNGPVEQTVAGFSQKTMDLRQRQERAQQEFLRKVDIRREQYNN